jgi:hypothetical protein
MARLTSYDNNGKIELYLYEAQRPLSPGNPVCVSCNPSGAPAAGDVRLTSANGGLAASPSRRNAFLTRNLSSDGNRVFFQTEEALVPGDGNGQLDVYEWEREGAGSCEPIGVSFDKSAAGCVYLISSGESAQPSYFGDAGADGEDVFFFTRQSLVGQDNDLNVDVYDARVDGGIVSQNPPPPVAPCTEGTCRGGVGTSPAFGVPASATITGTGNPADGPSASPVKPLTKQQKLAKALLACKKRGAKKRRHACEAQARKRYRVDNKQKKDAQIRKRDDDSQGHAA